MALNNDQDASTLNIYNLDSRYKQYSQTLKDLRDPNNLSYTNSNITNGVESVNTNSAMPNVQQGPDLKEQILNIITSNTQPDNLKQVTFNNVQKTTFVDDIDDFPLDEAEVTCQQMSSLQTLTTDISKAISNQKPFEPNFNFLEEGHFHREKPQAKQDNLKRIRSRLLLDSKDSHFFDITGELKNDAPTLRHVTPSFLNEPCSRAPYDSDESSLVFLPASTWTIENSNVARHVRVEIIRIRFISHELSSDQDLLTNQLQFLYDSCMSDIKFPKTEYFMQKIQALREELKHHPDREKELLEEIVELHHSRDLEEKKMCEKRNSLLECWHMLKEARERSKPTTTISLRWKAKKFSEDEKQSEEVLFDQDIHQRATEIQRLHSLNNENVNVEDIAQELKEKHQEIGLRMPGETKWIPILTETQRADYKELSQQEQNRFKRLAKTKISVAFYMGVYEVLSDDVQISSDFVALPDVGCHAIALHVPPSIKVHIMESGNTKRHELATVTLPVFNGEPPVFTEYKFSSDQPLPNGRMVQGYIEARCFVQTDTESLETIYKDTRDENLRKESVIDKVKKRPILMSSKLMTELVSKHDPNDPYLTAAIATMKAHRFNETDEKKFALDSQNDATLFASMAASDIWKQIPNRAYDLIRPTAENPYLYNSDRERLKLYDVITQPPRATFSSFFTSIFGFFKRSKKSKSISPQEANLSHVIEERSTISLHIHQILLTPLRYSENETFSYTNSKEKVSRKSKESNILVRISLQSVENASAIVHGQPDDFNQQVELRLVNEGENIPNIKQIEEKTIRIDIFDEYSKEELQFIGTLQIPLRSIFINGQIEGIFSITSPHFTMEHVMSEKLSKLALSICLKPKLVFDAPHLPCPVAETDDVNDRAHNFWNILRSDFPSRNYSILVMTTDGKSMLPCRMATKQSIVEIKGFEELLAFVSMIPTNSIIEKQDKNAWATSDEVVQSNSGTNIEHALLLCNLLLGQNINAFVALGNDMITGYDAYVVVIEGEKDDFEDDEYFKSQKEMDKTRQKKLANRSKEIIDKDRITLFNPTNGRIYKTESDDITLFDISTIFNNRNVWFNIQDRNTPLYDLNWNFYNNKSWIPFFDTNYKYVHLNSPQPTDLEILKANEDRIKKIKKKVKQIVEETVESLRPKTKWFLSIKPNLKDILIARKEIEIDNDEKAKSFNELMTETIQKFNNYRIVGSPFFISYVYDGNANDGILRNEIYDEIKKREICSCYLSEDGKEETQETFYSHAVEIKAFPNEIYAIWVLLVALHPKQPKENQSRVENQQSQNVQENKNKVDKDNDESYSYYYEEEEEEDENQNNNKSKKSVHSSPIKTQIEGEEEPDKNNDYESTFQQDKTPKSQKSSKKSSPNSSTKHNSQKNSQKSSPVSSARNQKSKSEIASSESPKSSRKEKGQTKQKSEDEDDQIIEEEEEAESSSGNEKQKTSPSLIKSITITKTEEETKIEKHKRNKKSKSSQSSAAEDSSSYSEHETKTKKVLALAEKLMDNSDNNQNEEAKSSRSNKSQEPKSSRSNQNEDAKSARSNQDEDAKSARSNQDEDTKSVRSNQNEEVRSPRSNKSTQSENRDNNENEDQKDTKSTSSKRKKNGNISDDLSDDNKTLSSEAAKSSNRNKSFKNDNKQRDNLVKKRKNDSDDEGSKPLLKNSKAEDEEGAIYVISDISPSAPSQSLVKYRERMKNSYKRRRIYANSSEDSDDNNDSVYQMKKQAAKKNAFGSDVQTGAKRKQPTRRRNRVGNEKEDDRKELSSPVKNQKKKTSSRSRTKEDKQKNEKKASPVLLSSDSDNY